MFAQDSCAKRRSGSEVVIATAEDCHNLSRPGNTNIHCWPLPNAVRASMRPAFVG